MKTNSIKYRSQLLFVAAALVASVIVPPLVRADSYDDKIKQLQAQQAADRQQANVLQAQAQTYQQAVDQLQTQINSLQTQIDANTAKSNDLQRQINEAETELARQRNVLGQNIKAMYLEGDITTLEMLASSKDISTFVDKQQYRNSVKDKIKVTVDKISLLKNQLRTQKSEVERLLKEQQSMQDQLASDRNRQAEMLAYTDSQKQAFEAQIRSASQQIASLREQQRIAYANAFGGGTSSTGGVITYKNLTSQQFCGGGYPNYLCAARQDSFFDSWGEYNRECVSYAAWYMDNQGHSVPAFGNIVYGGVPQGNANNWEGVLINTGKADIIPGSSVSSAASVVGTVVYMPIGGVGHVGVVLGVSEAGWVRVGQYNIKVTGMYSEMDLKITPNLTFFRFH